MPHSRADGRTESRVGGPDNGIGETASLGAELAAEFERWRLQNERGGWRCRWRRRSAWPAQVAQLAGLHLPASAPLFFGARMRVVTGEVMSSALLAFGYIEAALTALMLRTLRPGDLYVDVGTHFGYEALLASHLVGPSGRVAAFEPNPDAYAVARHNLGKLPNASLNPRAVGDREGTLRLERPAIQRSAFARSTVDERGGGDSVMVELTTLDTALDTRSNRVRLLKVDVEGAEGAVLGGATRLLSRDAPLLVLEVDMPDLAGATSPRAIEYAEFLRPFGYVPFAFDYDGCLRVGPLGSMRPGHANVAFAAGDDLDMLTGLEGT